MANMIPISTVTVGSGGADSISFVNIPQIYTDLMVLTSIRLGTSSGSMPPMYLRFNSATSTYNGRINLIGNGSTVSSSTSGYPDGAYFGGTDGISDTTSTFSNTSIYIPNYTSSNNKTYSSDTVAENNATTAHNSISTALWASSAPISGIYLFNPNYNMVQYSSATLYGIRKY